MLLGTLALAVLNTMLLILIGLIGRAVFPDILGLALPLQDMILLVALMALSLSLAGIFQSASLKRDNLSRMAVARVLRAVTMVGLQLLLVVAISGGATWLLFADLSATLIQAVLLAGGVGMAGVWGLLRRPPRQLFKRLLALAKRHKSFPLISLPHLLAHSGLGLLLTSALGAFYGTAALGQYYLMRKLIYGVLAMFGTAIYQQAIAESAQVQREEVYSIARRALILVGAVSSVSAVIIFFAGPQLFALAAGKEWVLAGQMAMATVPLILMEPITSTFAFVPVFLGLQQAALRVAVLQGSAGVGAIILAGSLEWCVLSALTVSSIAMSSVMAGYVWWLLHRAKRVAEGWRP
jgi:O-antigen/teichoic acid export membrane protein